MKSIIPFGIGFLVSLWMIPWMKKLSLRFGYLDRSEGNPLKIHQWPIPHSGGFVFFATVSLFIVISFALGECHGFKPMGLLLGSGVAFGLGVWADLKTAIPYLRFIGQTLAGVILILFGTQIETVLFIAIPLTIFYVVGAMNAINMEDGLDGLAGGVALISLVGFSFLSALRGESFGVTLASLLTGLLLGFLFYNFHPSSIFMGDNGSYFLGFILAYLAVTVTSLDHFSTFLGPILIIGAPVFEAAHAILRRLKKGVPLFTGDRSHFYDQLTQKGLTVRQTVLLCWGIQVILVGTGMWVYFL
ncbi:MAG: undecaprenyl/decaprenyl-phosphate alpha-N-acetylglucosaminyl 1-phosphate transferase [Syntrophaceae bacterium]|nr:undecaprenyl/decaprenyl-phosphate alpha-N-acetylglucosaminyl 1-phosphate transferase [Syntrophaceae bacterium]